MTVPTISNLPIAMSRTQRPETFDIEGDAFFNAFRNTTVSEFQASIAAFNTDFALVNTAKDDAETAADEAEAAADIATSQAEDTYPWSTTGSTRAFAVNENTIFTDGHSYRCITATSAGQSPTTHPAKWQQITTEPVKIPYSARTSNTILDIDDKGYLIDFTPTSTYEQTIDTAANVGNGWYCFLRNSADCFVWLAGTGGCDVDGASSAYAMYPGEIRLLTCDGTEFRTLILKGFCYTFDSSDTFYKPRGYSRFKGLSWSGGSSGQRTNSASNANGGGGGGCAPFDLPASAFGTSEAITIGAGGTAVTTAAVGNCGSDTSIGTTPFFTVYGAESGYHYCGGSVIENLKGDNPEGYAGAQLGNGVWGGAACREGSSSVGNAIYGGAAGGYGAAAPANGGTSLHGGDGGDGSDTGNGTDGTQPGGGGGGTRTGTQSGAGAAGRVIIMGVV